MNQKHAYLIMAHNEAELLCKLIRCLDDDRNDLYIHLDEKFESVTAKDFKSIPQKAQIFFIDRKPIYWSGYSQIDCELRLLKAAVPNEYAYYHLISGVDLPIKSQDFIHNYFKEKQGKEFISSTKVVNWKIASRFKHYHFENFNRRIPRNWSRRLRYFNSLVQTCLFIDRSRKIPFKTFYWGQAWFSITHNFARHLSDNEAVIYDNFKNGFFNDEVFLATLLMNSEYGRNHATEESYARLIDWTRGKPYTWTSNELDEILNSNAIFARKFSMNKDKEVIERIINQIS